MSKLSSFRRRIAKRPVPFTRTSPQTGQVITSSGNPSLDLILGGGLPFGSICLVEEDKYATYSKVLAKYFVAEGICSRHSLFLGSLDDSPKEMIEKLPNPVYGQQVETDEIETQNGLRIAWRYNDLPMVNSEKANAPIGHHFNLLEQIGKHLLQFADTVTWSDDPSDNDIVVNPDEDETDDAELAQFGNDSDATYVMDSGKDIDLETSNNASTPTAADEENIAGSTETSTSLPTPPPSACKNTVTADIFENPKYFRLLKEVHHQLSDKRFHSGGALLKKSLCRVCITSLASPLWYDDHYGEDLLKFLTIMRAAIRSSLSVCLITIPMHLVAKYDDTLVSKIRNLVDYAIELESFAGSDKETNPAFKEYHGLIHLRKITAINTLSAYMPETTDLAFKLRRKKFVIENLHLPPELQEDNNVTAMDTQPTLSCGSNISSNPKISMDF